MPNKIEEREWHYGLLSQQNVPKKFNDQIN